MTGRPKGRAFAFVTDKNIYDALNEHKVDGATLAGLFHARNTLVSGEAPRKWLAEYFATLSHDYYDHKNIAAKLGIISRRERVTSLLLTGVGATDEIMTAINQVKDGLEQHGDTVNIHRSHDRVTLKIEYAVVDYRRSEFNQIQEKDGEIEFQREGATYVVRNTQNEYVNAVRDMVINSIKAGASSNIQRSEISLQGWPDAEVRSRFFSELISGLPSYALKDVTDVYVYKAGAAAYDEYYGDEAEPHIERVSLRGTGVTQTEYLSQLAKDGYYIVKVGWRFAEELGKGFHYAAEILFADPINCTGFSYILLGVHESEAGKVAERRRTPTKFEITHISRVIEARARKLLGELSLGAAAGGAGD